MHHRRRQFIETQGAGIFGEAIGKRLLAHGILSRERTTEAQREESQRIIFASFLGGFAHLREIHDFSV
jgi:hypothetical protein